MRIFPSPKFEIRSHYRYQSDPGAGRATQAQSMLDGLDWHHPIVKHGLVPGHLIKELFGYSDAYWPKWIAQHPELYQTVNGAHWFCLDAVKDWVASTKNENQSQNSKSRSRRNRVPMDGSGRKNQTETLPGPQNAKPDRRFQA